MASALKLVRLITAVAAFDGSAACARLRLAIAAPTGTPPADMLASERRLVAALAIALILPPVAIMAASGAMTASEPRLLFAVTNAGDWIVALAPGLAAGACAIAE